MSEHTWLKQRGYLSPDCRCGLIDYEIAWNPACPIHKDDVIGANYKERSK